MPARSSTRNSSICTVSEVVQPKMNLNLLRNKDRETAKRSSIDTFDLAVHLKTSHGLEKIGDRIAENNSQDKKLSHQYNSSYQLTNQVEAIEELKNKLKSTNGFYKEGK